MKIRQLQQLQQESDEETQKGKSLKYLHGEAGTTGVGEAGNAYQSASMIAMGSGFQGVGMLSSLTNLVTAFLFLRVPSIINMLGSRKRAIVVLSFLDAACWLPIIVILLWFRHISPTWLLGMWILNLVPGLLAGAARNSCLADLTATGSRGKYLGIRSSIMNCMYLTSFYVMAYLLGLFPGERIFTGFALVFFIAFIASTGSFLLYTRVSEPRGTTREDARFGFIDFLRETSRRNLGRFILFASLFNFSVYLATPFFSVYLLQELHFPYLFFAIVSSSELAARVVAVTLWGKYADKAGNLRILGIASFSIPFVPVLWLVSHNVSYLVIVQLFSGAMWAGFDLCVVNFIYQTASPEKRLRYILYHQTLNRASMALGSLLGVFLLTRITPVMGSKILALFLLSGLLRFAVAGVLFPRLREIRKSSHTDDPRKEPAIAWPVARPGGGILYRPWQWAQLVAQPVVASGAREVVAAIASRQSLFYRRGEWQRSALPAAAVRMEEKVPVEIVHGRGLYYKPRLWNWLNQQLAAAPVASRAAPVVAVNRGLFYQPRQWSGFTRQP